MFLFIHAFSCHRVFDAMNKNTYPSQVKIGSLLKNSLKQTIVMLDDPTVILSYLKVRYSYLLYHGEIKI